MKNNSHKISANEINRFVYCPYQWYYTRCYGSKALHERYKALDIQSSQHESNFVKGQKFHHHYYRSYRFKRVVQSLLLVLLISTLVWLVIRWK